MKMPIDPDLGEDERSEEEKAQDAAEMREYMARFRLGGEAQPAFESSKEAFMTGAQVATSEETLTLPAPRWMKSATARSWTRWSRSTSVSISPLRSSG